MKIYVVAKLEGPVVAFCTDLEARNYVRENRTRPFEYTITKIELKE